MLRELNVQIPDLSKIKSTNQEPNQIKDFTIDLEIDVFLSEVFGKSSILARSSPGYYNLRALLQNPFAEKAVVEFRQGIFDEIYQGSLEAPLDHIVSDLSFSASEIPKYPDESPSQYLARQEAELGDRVNRFKAAIESLDALLKDAKSDGLQQVHKFATDIKESEEFQETDQRLNEYIQSCRKSDSSFWARIMSKRIKSKHELMRNEKEERFKFLKERSKLKELENQIKVYTTVARFFRKLSGIGVDLCLPKMLDSRHRCAKITDVINPILAAIKGNEVVPNDIHYNGPQYSGHELSKI